ncbi:ligase-associated DNA damage response DEXH box helicase [Chitinophaga sancti]|uniref:ATP-dependent helicase Lhr and Lhr-like helicase n=1 Tax=Chitinophaga sancti TaxID=1004 RepID=A0A1K1RDA2_9BACT|nr:ligase-associated DNA damage response DEXH box helicase [Chitinophaga sancti]WQD65647.1 ligase-associated DNA damage response DEXH box helicase [Chitinophaga sancti]WQG88731.1 ligase-associated DNA damage response DEXH box helicase [Chitinophaga sancti]SFW70005.1 ATP-dependent helicase Lhr and Lhr-like helicase [Chitinophaga sancti]
MKQTASGWKVVTDWLAARDRQPFAFQEEAWNYYLQGKSGLVNAPTGYGKTFSLFLGVVIDWINRHPKDYQSKTKNGLQLLWITPLRALAKDIARAMEEVLEEMGMPWQVGIRSGDTPVSARAAQKKNMPEVLLITPESLHLLIGQKEYPKVFQSLSTVVADEWHELLGTKRGVMIELGLSRLKGLAKKAGRSPLRIWGISATIGNLDEAMEVLLGVHDHEAVIVRAKIDKKIELQSILPDEIEKYPWAGHLGTRLLYKALPIVNESRTTLIFTNVRSQTEIWYQEILRQCPDLAGALALHHGSIDMELRIWVEEALHTGTLKAVVCTSSLDLGVDFRPVDTVIQVGSPKGVARFLQRAGRSGHQPGATSKIWFLPTHSLELVEAAALKSAIAQQIVESRMPVILAYDVLLQYLMTLAISDGFHAPEIWEEVTNTFCFRDMTEDEWVWVLAFLTTGGDALYSYDEFKKIDREGDFFICRSRMQAMRHRLHIGVIVSDAMLKVKFMGGGFIGMIEEWFIARLTAGDTFSLGGRILEFVMIKDMTVLVRKSNAKKAIVPSWMGGRLPLSPNLGKILRETFNEALSGNTREPELLVLQPLFNLQEYLSHVPKADELLIEMIHTRDGYHLFAYPFEGRLVNEVMATLLAYRLSKRTPITFSIAMNDYGFELLSDQPIPLTQDDVYALFSLDHLSTDLQASVNSTEMARRKFRDIAVIAGLIFQGYPGKHKQSRHLQSSASLLFNVFTEYDSQNLLLRQAFNEAFFYQMEEARLRESMERINNSKIVITYPKELTPFCFPIKVDSLREQLTSEKLEDRIKKMRPEF